MKFTPFSGKIDERKNIAVIAFETFVFGTVGLLLGTLIDKQFAKLRKKLPTFKVSLIVAQILTLGLVIWGLYKSIPGEFVEHFQITLPGMAFPAMYFGVQSSLFTAAQEF